MSSELTHRTKKSLRTVDSWRAGTASPAPDDVKAALNWQGSDEELAEELRRRIFSDLELSRLYAQSRFEERLGGLEGGTSVQDLKNVIEDPEVSHRILKRTDLPTFAEAAACARTWLPQPKEKDQIQCQGFHFNHFFQPSLVFHLTWP